MKVGDRVKVNIPVNNNGEWKIKYKYGTIKHNFLLCVGNQELYQVECDDGTTENAWNNLLELVKSN